MLTTVAALVIILGLMVSLARYVRSRETEALTRQVLAVLDDLLRTEPKLQTHLNTCPPLLSRGQKADEASLQESALANNRAMVLMLRQEDAAAFRRIPTSLYDALTLRDAWGTPVVYMASGAANIGMEPQQRAFFLSAGADRRFSTILDNLYSYDTRRPAAGHRE